MSDQLIVGMNSLVDIVLNRQSMKRVERHEFA